MYKDKFWLLPLLLMCHLLVFLFQHQSGFIHWVQTGFLGQPLFFTWWIRLFLAETVSSDWLSYTGIRLCLAPPSDCFLPRLQTVFCPALRLVFLHCFQTGFFLVLAGWGLVNLLLCNCTLIKIKEIIVVYCLFLWYMYI